MLTSITPEYIRQERVADGGFTVPLEHRVDRSCLLYGIRFIDATGIDSEPLQTLLVGDCARIYDLVHRVCILTFVGFSHWIFAGTEQEVRSECLERDL